MAAPLAVASYLQFLLTGLPGASVLAVLAGFPSLIPWIGGSIATLIVTGVASLQGSTAFVDMPNWRFALLALVTNGLPLNEIRLCPENLNLAPTWWLRG